MADRTRWTHRTPQHGNDEGGHYPAPSKATAGAPKNWRCATCGMAIRPMRRNEGPEGLAAYFVF